MKPKHANKTLAPEKAEPKHDGDIRPLDALLEAIVTVFKRYVIFRSQAQVRVIALWVLHTHTIDAFDFTPYLHIKSPTKRCAKTRVMQLLAGLSARPWRVGGGVSGPSLFRRIEACQPTVLLDEIDRTFKDKDNARDITAILNDGFQRGGVVSRCVDRRGEWTSTDFEVFCPKALAGLCSLPDTTADRCIQITLRRKGKQEQVGRLRDRTVVEETAALQLELAAWGKTAVEALVKAIAAEPAIPDAIDDRGADIVEPLIAIADLAGGTWPSQARKDLVLLRGSAEDTEADGELLLRAIRDIRDTEAAIATKREVAADGKIRTVDLLQKLVDRDLEPWPGLWGKEVDQATEAAKAGRKLPPRRAAMQLAKMLHEFGVTSRTVRTICEKGMGYCWTDFDDAFARYLPPPNPDAEGDGAEGDGAK